MAKKISRVLASNRDYILRPFALVNHTHEFYANTVADLTERDALEGENRYEGVIYYVKSDQTTYQLRGGSENTDWVVLVSAGGASSHLDLTNIGTNTHDQIDTHIADSTLHFTQASISITESQISDLQAYALASHDHDAEYLGISATAAAADALATTGAVVDVSAAAPPVAGQILTATSATAATWQNAAAAGIGDIIQTGSPSDTYVGYFSADKNLTGDAGFTWITAAARLNVIGATPEFRLQDNNNAAATMVAELSFWDSTAVTARIRMDGTGNLRIENTAGEIRFDTGTSDVVVSGNGDLSVGNNLDIVAYLTSYGGTPADGSTLQWNTGNARAEFTLGAVMNAGTPVDNQVALWTTANTIEGDANFTWSGTILDIAGLGWDSTVDKLTLGNADLSVPGIEITGSATASPYLNLVQDGVVRAIFKYSQANTALEISSTADNIKLRPGNVDTYSFTQATLTAGNLVFNIDQTVGASEDGYLFVYDNTAGEISLTDTIPYLITGDPGLEGTGITIAGLSFDAVLKASNIGNGDSELILHKHSTTTAATLIGARAASDTNTHAAVADNDTLLNIAAVGWDGTDYQWGAGIKFRVDGTVAANDVPGEIVFQVDGLTEAMVLRSSGNLELTGALFTAGTYIFDTDQVVGAGVDNYVLTYDNTGGLIALEAIPAEVNDLTAAVTWANVPDANITQSSVTQHVGAIDHDSLLNFTATEHFTQAAISIPLSQISDVTALAAELNLLDLAGLTAGWVLSADTATTASWKAPAGGGAIGGSITDNQIAVGATTADDIEGNASFTFDASANALRLGTQVTGQIEMGGTAESIRWNNTLDTIDIYQDSQIVIGISGTQDVAMPWGNLRVGGTSATNGIVSVRSSAATDAIVDFYNGATKYAELRLDNANLDLDIRTQVAGAEVAVYSGLGFEAMRWHGTNGDTAMGGYLTQYNGGTPTDTHVLTWVTANGRAEFVAAGGGSGIGGSIADNQIAVGAATADQIEGSSGLTFDSATSALGIGTGGQTIIPVGTNTYDFESGGTSSGIRFSNSSGTTLATLAATATTVQLLDELAGNIFTFTKSTNVLSFSGQLATVASTTTIAGLNVPHGTAPTAPVNGDIWTTTAGVFARVNGVTNQLDGGGGGIGGSIADNQIAVGAATADDIEGQSTFTFTEGSGASALNIGSASWSIFNSSVTSGLAQLCADNVNTTGAKIVLYGSTYPIFGGDIAIASGNSSVWSWDESVGIQRFYQGNGGSKAQVMALYQDTAFFGPQTGTADFTIHQGVNAAGLKISGGGETTGARITLRGGAHATLAGDMAFGNDSDDDWMSWDESSGQLQISTGIGASKTLTATFNPTVVALGNYDFNVDQTVGVGQDGYVLTYNHSGTEIELQAAGGGGGSPWTYTLQTGTSYTAAAGDFVVCSNAGFVTVTLPSGHSVNDTIIVKKTSSGAGTVTVDGNASETIDGATTFIIAAQYSSITLISDGTNWLIV